MNDYGWTTPWSLPGQTGRESEFFTQSDVTAEGDMALEMAGPGALERRFPALSAGVVKIEMHVRPETVTVDITDEKASVLKVYAADENNNWAVRWHYPFAWPEVGGNVYPRFYVIDGKGTKKKGIEPTDVRVEAGTWYKVAAVLDVGAKTWQFSVDDVQLDAMGKFGREMEWWKKPSDLCKIRIGNAGGGRNWIDLVQVWHDGKLHARTGFNSDEGYAAGKTVVG